MLDIIDTRHRRKPIEPEAPYNPPELFPEPPDATAIIVDQAALGLGDALQGFCVSAGLAAETGLPVRYNCGIAGIEACQLLHSPGVSLGVAERNGEDTKTGARQLNLGYRHEKATRAAVPRWNRFLVNVGAKSLRFPPLKDPVRIRELGRKYAGAVVLCPWSKGVNRMWGIHHWKHLETMLHAAGIPTAILDDKAERSNVFAGEKVIGQPFGTVAAAMLNAACVIGVDSGLSHLAGVLQAPSIVLGGQTRVGQIFGCYPQARCIQGGLSCSGCFEDRSGDVFCYPVCSNIQTIQPQTVFEEVAKLWPMQSLRTLVSPDRCIVIRNELLRTAKLTGDIAEFGVYKGGTARLMSHVAPDATMHLFDTFTGIPEDDAILGGHKVGDFADTSLDAVRAYVANPNAQYHVGWFPGQSMPDVQFRFVHADCDTYQSVLAALDYFAPRMVKGGVMVFDDYEWQNCPGVERALGEWFHGRIERGAKYQAIVRF